MSTVYDLLRFVHIVGFVFMSVPLFNLIIVNERISLSQSFNYYADRYMENIIKNGAYRCFVFQATVLASGVLLTLLGPLGVDSLWSNWVVATKLALLIVLMVLLSYVHFRVQPRIEMIFTELKPDVQVPENLAGPLKCCRLKRKRLATLCLFLVLTTIIFGLQVYDSFKPSVTVTLIILGALFSYKANKTILRFGWI